ncbi:MAG TPA: hypothetical protein VGH71_09720, partial [Gammaproteobacteria bacterium]
MPTSFIFKTFHAGLLASGVVGPILMAPAWHSEAASAEPAKVSHAPAPPQVYVDTRLVAPTGRTIQVKQGDDLQKALDQAKPGDAIVLQAGAVFTGPFTLPVKDGSQGWITIESSDLKQLPQGTRVGPADAVHMPKLQASYESVVRTAPGAGHYRLIGLEVRPGPPRGKLLGKILEWLGGIDSADAAGVPGAAFLENLMVFGSSSSSTLDSLPDHIIIDRCYLHGDPQVGARRGVAMNART